MNFHNLVTKFLFLVCLFSAAAMSSCKKDQENEDDDPAGIEEVSGVEYSGNLSSGLSMRELGLSGTDAIHDGDKWVVVGNGIFSSEDAIGWSEVIEGDNTSFNEIEYHEGKYVAIKHNGIFHSTNGTQWIEVSTDEFFYSLNNLFWADGFFYTMSGTFGLYRSPDGVNWTLVNPFVPDIHELSAVNGFLVGLVGSLTTRAVLSTDQGITWSDEIEIDNSSVYDRELVRVEDELYLFRGSEVFKTSDGAAWLSLGPSGDIGHNVTYGNSTFYCIGSYTSGGTPSLDLGLLKSSNDGLTWTQNETGTHGLLDKVEVAPNNERLAIGDDLLWSVDGATWGYRMPNLMGNIIHAKWCIDRAVLTDLGDKGALVTSDFIDFELIGYDAIGDGFVSVVWNGEYYIGVGTGGVISLIDEEGNYQNIETGSSAVLSDVGFMPNVACVAVGNAGRIMHSTDCETWTTVQFSEEIDFTSIEVFNDLFYATSNKGLYASFDGIDWSFIEVIPNEFDGPELLGLERYGNTVVALSGDFNKELFISQDGGNTWGFASSHNNLGFTYNTITHTGNEFVAVFGDVTPWVTLEASTDGIEWTEIFSFDQNYTSNSKIIWTGSELFVSSFVSNTGWVGTVE